MLDRLMKELVGETRIEDIADTYRPVVDIIGVEQFVAIGDYARGDELYFPMPETIVAPARNRRIKKEYNGYNARELAVRYDLTIKQVSNILRDADVPGQLALDLT